MARHHELRDEPTNRLVGITCDHCLVRYDDILEIQEFWSQHTVGGYNSTFGDMRPIDHDLCQHCAKIIFGDEVKVGDPVF